MIGSLLLGVLMIVVGAALVVAVAGWKVELLILAGIAVIGVVYGVYQFMRDRRRRRGRDVN